MGRREFVRASAGLIFIGTAGGCLQEDEFDPTRDTACSHVPESADRVPYTVDEQEVHSGQLIFRNEKEPFAMITASKQLEERFTEEELANIRETTNVLSNVDFDGNALLIWEGDINNLSRKIEFLDVIQPTEETVRAYGCRYQKYDGGGEAMRSYRYCLSVEVGETPTRAEFIYHWKTSTSEGDATYTDTPKKVPDPSPTGDRSCKVVLVEES